MPVTKENCHFAPLVSVLMRTGAVARALDRVGFAGSSPVSGFGNPNRALRWA